MYTDTDITGRTIGNYKIIRKLGRGGMAVVYKAHEESLNRVVALKIPDQRLLENPVFVKRFQREAQAAAQLNHPNIVQIYSFGEQEGIYYYAMEYVKGRPLNELIKEDGGVLPIEAANIICQVAEALAVAHKAGVVHRDIKPANIIIDSLGRVKVTDFGIAQISSAGTKLTTEGSLMGTPEYLSPDQFQSTEVDGRSDVYSLGVTFYEMLCGKTPFEADTPAVLVMKIMEGKYPLLKVANPTVPENFQRIVERMMARDRDQRYRTDELVADLKRLKIMEESMATVVAEPTAVATVATAATVATVATQKKAVVEEPIERRKTWRLVAVAVAIVLLFSGIVAAAYFANIQAKKQQQAAAKEEQKVVVPPPPEPSKEPEAPKQEPAPAASAPVASAAATPQEKRQSAPPRKSVVVITKGDYEHVDTVNSYVESLFRDQGFKIVDSGFASSSKLRDVARLLVVITVKMTGSTTLVYYGRSTPQYTAALTMKIVATQDGSVVAGPATKTVKFTSINAEENLKDSSIALARQLEDSIR